MKVLLISGSPRNGNTEYILKRIYEKLDCEKELILLRNKHIEHCIGCLTCHNTFKCPIKDDMNEIIEKMITSDEIIFGVPNYFDNVTSLFKTFIDRCHPLYKSKYLQDKKVTYIFIGGGKIEGTKKVMLNAVNGFNKYLGLDLIDETSIQALEKDEVMNENIDIKIDEKIKKLCIK